MLFKTAKMKTLIKNYFLLIITLVFSVQSWSVELPVLPYPQQVFWSSSIVAYPSKLNLIFNGTDQQVSDRLKEVWDKFARENANRLSASTLYIGLLSEKDISQLIATENLSSVNNLGDEGYVLIIDAKKRLLAANTEAGLFYGLQTLKQLTRAGWKNALKIVDWPSFPHRVVYDDISRGPIPTVDYFKKQIERMAELKLNYLSFYIEHVVQPVSHPDFAPENGKLTIAQIKELSGYAEKFHMQLIGSFQSFGHFEKILSLPKYKSMGETTTLISPLDPTARKFLAEVIGELCDAFNAPYFNVNCDETFDLGKGKSKPYVDSVGAAKFYADHLKFLYDVVKSHGKRMMMWGDIALQHEEVLDMLPKDVIYLTWEYGDKKSFDPWIRPFVKRGLEFMVCPGILNSYRMFPDMVMAKTNIRGFLKEGIKNGASGAFTTIWDDGGTYLFAGDWYGVYVAADKSWNVTEKYEPGFDKRFSIVAFNTENANYVRALFTLMELRSVDMTYNLNDQVWYQKILPDSGKTLIMNNASLKQVTGILNAAAAYAASAKVNTNQADLEALKYAIEQYRLIADTRAVIAKVVSLYAEASGYVNSAPSKARNILNVCVEEIGSLQTRYTVHADLFRRLWLSENQFYWLDKALEPYERKKKDLLQLQENLKLVASNLISNRGVPTASSLRLDIAFDDRFYFKNWMLGGPFPLTDSKGLPVFLYSSEKDYNKPPSPGDFTHYLGKTYRWQKFSSTDGGIIDLDDHYQYLNAVSAYAYCLVNAPEAMTIKAFVKANDQVEVYCNADKIFSGKANSYPHESILSLSLKKGVNHILFKIRNAEDHPWRFTFRLQDDLSVTNHKHKYTLNATTKEYEAD